MVVTNDAQGGRVQKEITARRGFQTEPASAEHVKKMSAGKEQHIAVDGADPADDSIDASSHISDRLAAGTTVAEQLPFGPLLANLIGRFSFVGAVVPFDEIMIHRRDTCESGQFARPRGPLQRTRQDADEGQAFEPVTEPTGVALTALGQGKIRQAGVLASKGPGCLTVPGQVDQREWRTGTGHNLSFSRDLRLRGKEFANSFQFPLSFCGRLGICDFEFVERIKDNP